MKAAALDLAERFRVFPLWPVLPAKHADGFICGCGKLNCANPGKHPLGKLAKRGCKDATQDPERIRWLWKCRPDANIGLATGDGLVAIDIDLRHGGDQAIADLQKKHGRLPATLTSRTGGGWHVFFEGDLPNSVGTLGPGLDIRASSGYCVAPPSLHVSGRRYEWRSQAAPIAPLPNWIEGELGKQRKRAATPEHWRIVASNNVVEGKRNDTIARLTGHLLSRYVDPLVVLDLMQCWNACHCTPPLSTDEVNIIVNSICGCEQRRGVA